MHSLPNWNRRVEIFQEEPDITMEIEQHHYPNEEHRNGFAPPSHGLMST
jgi:hypothetical protein